MAEEGERLDEVADRAPHAVERRDHDDVDLTGSHGGEQPVEAGAPLPGAGHAHIDVLLGLPAAGGDVLAEVAQLRLAALVPGAHAVGERHPLRRCGRAKPDWRSRGHTLACIYM